MTLVEGHQLIIAEIWDSLGITTAVVVISTGWEKLETQTIPQYRRNRRHRPFHLIKNNPFVDQRCVGLIGG